MLLTTISQQLADLVPNQSYDVDFLYGFAQQSAPTPSDPAQYSGITTQHWMVCLGSSTNCQSTASVVLPSHGFSGWLHEDFIFTAQTVNDVLSFSAFGDMPDPPFALLDGVSVSAVTEPMSLPILGVGLLGLIVVGLRRHVGAC
jgi:hypothetical protein